MSLYSPFTYFKETYRLLFQKRVKDGQLAFLGDTDGTGARVEVPDAPGYVYARFQNVPDANGNATFSAPFLVRSGNAAFQNYPGASVYVAAGYNRELEIVSANYQELTRNGIDTRTLNPLHQQSKWVYLWQLTIGLCSAVANSVNGSFLVTVKKYRHYVNNVFATFETGAQAAKIDLAPYVPAVDMHCYAAVWVDTYANTAYVTTSTAQSMFTTLDDTDIQECVADRPPDAIPHKLFYLSNAQGTITQQAVKDVDVRQFLNTPQTWGFPNPVAYRERIQPDRQQLFAGSLVVTGSLQVLGSLIGVPTVSSSGGGSSGITQLTGDVTAGPGSGSQVATIANNAVTTVKINDGAVTYTKIAEDATPMVCDYRLSTLNTDDTLADTGGGGGTVTVYLPNFGGGNRITLYDGRWYLITPSNGSTPQFSLNGNGIALTVSYTNGGNVMTTNIAISPDDILVGMRCIGVTQWSIADPVITAITGTNTFTCTGTATATNSGVNPNIKAPLSSNIDFFAYMTGTNTDIALAGRTWTNNTTRAVALAQTDGRWHMTAAPEYTYIGSVHTDSVGLVSDTVLLRQLWNYFNPRYRILQLTSGLNTINDTNTSIHQFNASTVQQVQVMIGMANLSNADLQIFAYSNIGGMRAGVGYDSTTTFDAPNLGRRSAADAFATGWRKLMPDIGNHILSFNSVGGVGGQWFGSNVNFESGMAGGIYM